MKETELLRLYREAPGSGGERQPVSVMEPLMKRHQEALAAQRSTLIRIEEGHAQLRALAAKIFDEVVTLVETTDARLAAMDVESPHYSDLVAFADQYLGVAYTNAIKMLGATGQQLVNQSGDDVRDDADRASEEEAVDPMFGATVLPSYTRVLRPTKGKGGKTTYAVVDPGGFHG